MAAENGALLGSGMGQAPAPPSRRHIFLKEWRTYRKLRQEDVAAELEMDQSNYSKVENEKIPFDHRKLPVLAQLFQCSVSDLYRNPDQLDEIDEVASRLRSADPEDLARALSVLDALLKPRP